MESVQLKQHIPIQIRNKDEGNSQRISDTSSSPRHRTPIAARSLLVCPKAPDFAQKSHHNWR